MFAIANVMNLKCKYTANNDYKTILDYLKLILQIYEEK